MEGKTRKTGGSRNFHLGSLEEGRKDLGDSWVDNYYQALEVGVDDSSLMVGLGKAKDSLVEILMEADTVVDKVGCFEEGSIHWLVVAIRCCLVVVEVASRCLPAVAKVASHCCLAVVEVASRCLEVAIHCCLVVVGVAIHCLAVVVVAIHCCLAVVGVANRCLEVASH